MSRSAFTNPLTSVLLPSEHVDIQYHSLSDPSLPSQIHGRYPSANAILDFSLCHEKRSDHMCLEPSKRYRLYIKPSISPPIFTRAPDSSQVDDGKAGGAPEVWQVRWLG